MPRLPIRLAAAAAICAVPFLGFAQMRSAPAAATPMPGNPESTPPAASADTQTKTDTQAKTGTKADTNATTPSLKSGMTVKDSTGATIGKIAKLDNDTATIKMSSGTFTAPTSTLAVEGKAATINMTKADIEAQVKASKPKS
jgi:hypothetical protein